MDKNSGGEGACVGRRCHLAGLSKADMNGRAGVCTGIEGSGPAERLVIKLDPVGSEAKAKSVKVGRGGNGRDSRGQLKSAALESNRSTGKQAPRRRH